MPSSPFPDRLLEWWDANGRKSLPWQNPRDPYRVWISEIMLQQTQVAAVIPYFERWMDRFPDLPALAKAPLDDVLSLWSGLGYYARARNLHAAAQLCVEHHGGHLPDSAKMLGQLPGIGPSTANAIISLAFDRPAAVLDGNVKRILARHAGIEGWPGKSATQRVLWREAETRLPAARGADYSQAIMDLGALVCAARNPQCGACPVAEDCRARRLDAQDRIPAPRPGKEVPTRVLHMLVVRDESGRVLLQRRPPSGIWGGLWSLPEGPTRRAARSRIGLNGKNMARNPRCLPAIEHRLTHMRLRIRPALMTLSGAAALKWPEVRETSDMAWFAEADWSELGLPKPVNQLLQNLEREIHQ